MFNLSIRYAVALCILIINFDLGGGHEISSLDVPLLADPRDNVTLRCQYNMGNEQLYSAKWFKDDFEIFRYMPAQDPPGLSFSARGINLAQEPKCTHSSCDIVLTSLSSQSQGKYRCEVSTEAPTFKIVYKVSYMTIAALPRKDPALEGLRSRYSLGEEIDVNCTSDVSLPAQKLTFYVNDEEASVLNVRGPWEAYRDHQGLSSRSLGLQLIASRSMFAEVGLKIRCVALLPDSVPGGPHLRQTQEMVYLAPTVILEKLASPVSSGSGIMSLCLWCLIFYIITWLNI